MKKLLIILILLIPIRIDAQSFFMIGHNPYMDSIKAVKDSIWAVQELIYKCPNGCKNAKFYYLYSTTTAMNWNQYSIDEYGNTHYNKNPNISTDYYQCSVCNRTFIENILKQCARNYNDSLKTVIINNKE